MSDTRLNFVVDRELVRRLDTHLGWGDRSVVLRKMIEILVAALDKAGPVGVGLILNDQLELRVRNVKAGPART